MCAAKLVFLWLFAVAVSFTDIRYRKVPNRLVVFASVCGIALCATGGWSTLATAFSGMALGFALLLPAFSLGMVGGGDVKSLAVVGLATGPGLLWISFLYGAATGGLLALLMLSLKRLSSTSEHGSGRASSASMPSLPYAAILTLAAAVTASFL